MNDMNTVAIVMNDLIRNPVIVGISVPYILSLFGVLIGQEGVDYYGEVHSTFHNAMVHTIFMPFTIYGMLLWIPNTLIYFSGKKYNEQKKILVGNEIQYFLYYAYMIHYLTIHIGIAVLLISLYAFPLLYAQRKYIKNNPNDNHIVTGLAISSVSLVIQEIFGHYYGGDDPSRPEAIFNAILYAMYFSVGHFFR